MAESFSEPLNPETGENSKGQTGVVMLHRSGSNPDMSWFECRPDFDSDRIMVTWPASNGMYVVIESDIAQALLNNNWARKMTTAEITEVNDSLKGEEP